MLDGGVGVQVEFAIHQVHSAIVRWALMAKQNSS